LSTIMQNNTIVTPPDTPLLANKYEYNIYQKTFKDKAGLACHNIIIRKYSIQKKLLVVLANLLDLFKNDLVYFIHHQLSNSFKNAGKKTVSITCSKNQFYTIFGDYIHFYSKKTGIYRCVFCGLEGEQKLNQIFGRTD
ncbi:40210_t:CDS:1, partial [Gigaspora margarita]